MLIILSGSPGVQNYDSVLAIAKRRADEGERVDVLLIQDVCIVATMAEFCGRLVESRIGLYTLKADCEARGLVKKVSSKVEQIDYRRWVRLVMTDHDKIVSWTS